MHTFTSQIKASQTKVLKNIKDINKRRLKFLELTASFYNSTNRAEKIDQYNNRKYCVYESFGGTPGCAIGRWVSKDSDFDFSIISPVFASGIFNKLPMWMREMGKNFLQGIQLLHDHSNNWNKQGLTELGQKILEEIKVNINNGIYES